MSVIKLRKILDTAEAMRKAERDASEELKIKTYRAGSTGLFQDGKFYGVNCARTSLLRSNGIDIKEISDDRVVMFEGGVMNETIWKDNLQLGSDYLILAEEEIPTSWLTEKGTPVLGRPDLVLCDPTTKVPILGLELKMVSAFWTGYSVLCQNLPKMTHLLQASHYMWQLNIPFKLVYTSYVDFIVPSWGVKDLPKPGEHLSEFFEYSPQNKKTGIYPVKKMLPFKVIYDIKFSPEGVVLYKKEQDLTFNRSVVTLQGIKGYFEELDKVKDSKQLPDRPINIKSDGIKENWTICNYCPLSQICDSSEETYDKWMEAVSVHNKKNKPTI